MKPLTTNPQINNDKKELLKCISVFSLILSSFLFVSIISKEDFLLLSQVLLLFSGWLCWTFIEYINHRFWSHSDLIKKKGNLYEVHMQHHHHPTEIKISDLQRIVMLLVNIGLVVLSFMQQNFITFITGLVSGFVLYSFMHVILHQQWSAKLFPQLHQFHIHHHCKYPNHCFGVSVIWWDLLFKTSPPHEAKISDRILAFYYKQEKKAKISPC